MQDKTEESEKKVPPPGLGLAAILGARVRALRASADLSQADFAKLIGAGTQDAITRMERGIIKVIQCDLLAALIRYASKEQRDAHWLLTGISGAAVATEDDLLEQLSIRIFVGRMADEGVTFRQADGTREPIEVGHVMDYGGLDGFLEGCLNMPDACGTAKRIAEEVRKQLRRTEGDATLRAMVQKIAELQRLLDELHQLRAQM